ncbi:MAG: hypothetical protein BJ554DRAFT_4996, partial [Olpidium bornovanus]
FSFFSFFSFFISTTRRVACTGGLAVGAKSHPRPGGPGQRRVSYFWGSAGEVGEGEGRGFNVNVPLAHGITAKQYLEELEKSIQTHIIPYEPEVVVVSLGGKWGTARRASFRVSAFQFIRRETFPRQSTRSRTTRWAASFSWKRRRTFQSAPLLPGSGSRHCSLWKGVTTRAPSARMCATSCKVSRLTEGEPGRGGAKVPLDTHCWRPRRRRTRVPPVCPPFQELCDAHAHVNWNYRRNACMFLSVTGCPRRRGSLL